jgi:MoxR-like ATPase
VVDLRSHNGTFVNSRPATEPTPLKHMDVIQIGDTVLVYDEFDKEGLTRQDSAEPTQFDLRFLQQSMRRIQENIGRVIRGKDDAISRVILGLLSDGHVLIEDVPGVGKTMLAQALAKSIRSEFKRIQFTPDMLPTDVTGVNVYDEQNRQFCFVPGPIFANVVLADEINRGTPRTQSSLLECMSDAVVTVDGQAHVLPKPFFVVATQNPGDFHGTYPLPEAQLDRFLMRLHLGYPSRTVEREILASQVASHPINDISYVVRSGDVLQCQALVRTGHVSDRVMDYIATVVEATRQHPAFSYGCSPRASVALMRVSQSQAALQGRDYVLPRDVRDLAVCVLSHRLPLKLQARAEWENSEQVVQSILEGFPIEKWEAA